MSKDTSEQRFWAKVEKGESCWLWTGARNGDGYGMVYESRVTPGRRAHRESWELTNGPIPAGLLIDHVCHTRTCVRPSHLRLAGSKQNGEHRLGANTNSRSGVRGVSWNKKSQKWQAQLTHAGKNYNFGNFDTIAEAAEVVRAKRLQFFTRNDRDRAA